MNAMDAAGKSTGPDAPRSASADRQARRALWILLSLSAALRVWLVSGGGQGFWPDEGRYDQVRVAAGQLAAGEWHAGWAGIFKTADHLLFKVIALLPAILEHWSGAHPILPAFFFAIFSTLSLWMTGRIVSMAGGAPAQQVAAVFLAAGANSLFYYARHYFPYDVAMFFGLWAWARAVHQPPRGGYAVGLLAGLCFATYNGYWLLGGAAMAVRSIQAFRGGLRSTLKILPALVIGVLTCPLTLVVVGRALGCDLIKSYLDFSRTITQGEMQGSLLFMGGYFWHGEGVAGLVVMLAAGMGVLARGEKAALAVAVVRAALGMLMLRWLMADVLGWFVVYGRLVREVVPLLCVAGGVGLGWLWGRGCRWRAVAVAMGAIFIVSAGWNYARVLRQWFPREFRAEAARRLGSFPSSRGSFQLVHANFLYAPEAIYTGEALTATLWQAPHPQQYPPYLFEGFARAARREFLTRDASMRLITIGRQGYQGWLGDIPTLSQHGGYPGGVDMRLRLNREGVGRREPLVATGQTGRGDLLYVSYEDSAHIRWGFDHWGVGGAISPMLRVRWDQPQILRVSMGSMFPREAPAELRQRLLVKWNDQTVFDSAQEFHPSEPGDIVFGLNLIGASTADARFRGRIESVAPTEPESR